MPITYYPNETSKKLMHVIEQQQQPNALQSVYGAYDMNNGDLSANIWCSKGWESKRISVHFSNAVAKNYTISIVRGIGVIKDKNDRLWVKVNGLPAQDIIVPQGFYTGDTLSTALAEALNAKEFASSFKPFTVNYSSGTFVIAPASGNAKVFVTNTTTSVRRTSTIAPLIGFTSDSTMTNTIVSDQVKLGLNGIEMVIRSDTDSTNVDIMSTDNIAMTIDDELRITASYTPSGSPDLAIYEVVYKVLDI